MEADPFNKEVDQDCVNQLMEFGFPRTESSLALKITKNDIPAAADLLTSGGATLESLQALAQIARVDNTPK